MQSYFNITMRTVVVSIIIYGLALPLVAIDPTNRGNQVAAAIIVWTFSALYIAAITRWLIHLFSGDYRNHVDALWEILDVILSTYHILAALGFSIWLMDTSPAKDAYFVGITALTSPYSVYVGDFLMLTVTMLNSAGFSGVRPRASTPIASLWVILVSIVGLGLVVFLLGLVKTYVKLFEPREGPIKGPPARVFTSKFNKRYGVVRPRIYHNHKYK